MEKFEVHYTADIEYTYKYQAVLAIMQKKYPTADIVLITTYNVKDDLFIFRFNIKHLSSKKEKQIKKELGEVWQSFNYSIKILKGRK